MQPRRSLPFAISPTDSPPTRCYIHQLSLFTKVSFLANWYSIGLSLILRTRINQLLPLRCPRLTTFEPLWPFVCLQLNQRTNLMQTWPNARSANLDIFFFDIAVAELCIAPGTQIFAAHTTSFLCPSNHDSLKHC